MRIVVSGATGLVGRALVKALVARGDSVIGLSRRERTPVPGIEWVVGDPLHEATWVSALPGAHAVVHLAGENIGSRWTKRKKAALVTSRVDSTRALVTALARLTPRPRRLVLASASGYFGPRGEELLDEASAPGDDFLARLTVAWEDAARPARELGLEHTALRSGVVLAKEGGALQRMLPVFSAFAGGPLGDPQKWFPWIHLRDAVGLFLYALDGKLSGPVCAVAPEQVRMQDFARALGRVLGRPASLPVPEWALRLALGEAGAAIVPGQRIAPRAALAAGYDYRFPSLEAALVDLLKSSA